MTSTLEPISAGRSDLRNIPPRLMLLAAIFSAMTSPGEAAPVAETVITVRTPELDSFGHVNHAVFLNYLEQARFEALAAGGFSYDNIQDRGWAIHVVRVEVDYRAELRLGDELEIKTWISDYRRTTMVFAQQILRSRGNVEDAVIAAESKVVGVWIGTDGRPMRVPPEMKEALGAPSET